MRKMRKITQFCFMTLMAAFSLSAVAAEDFRPPAVPLVACDPYFSIWSRADALTDADTTHWTGKPHRMTALARIDGKTYRVMGAEPQNVPAMEQTDCRVLPTSTYCTFKADGLTLTLIFTTPALPEDLDLLSRPVTYLTFGVVIRDGKPHDVQLYFDASAEITVNTPDQEAEGVLEEHGDLNAIKIGSIDQAILAKRGDDIRIDWGYLYTAALKEEKPIQALAERKALQAAFIKDGPAAIAGMKTSLPAAAGDIAGATAFDLGKVETAGVRRILLAYDDLYSIQYMKKNLRPYWRRDGWEATDLLQASAKEYQALYQRCCAFDYQLMQDLKQAGGENYSKICALAYRQCFAAGKFVADENGQPLQFSKENHSNGCIATSDVFYPMAPQFLLFGPSVSKSFIVPFMNYAASERWRFPFAPHDLGQYPHANGQRYGGGETSEQNQMPVEECGNLMLLMGAVAKMEGNADFAGLYWPQLQQWAEYLKSKGFDPENQLCTDDFAGHLAHNVNLSAKAICALGTFGQLCALRGETTQAEAYKKIAKEFANRWVKEADNGEWYRLAFDRPDTWSQKYNLVWDRILGLDLFPDAVKQKEMAHYRKIQNQYGLPLDNRSKYTKLDWVLWSATLTQNREDFEAIVDPVYTFLNETPDRFPMTDWYFTDSAKRRGFTARPVVGGVFLQMLYDQKVWEKYAALDKTKASDWAPMPTPPRTVELVPSSRKAPLEWQYTTKSPDNKWSAADFDASAWKTGPGGFGTAETPGAVVRTVWNTPDIWMRRTFDLKGPIPKQVGLRMHHDEDAQIYINGEEVLKVSGYTADYDIMEISAKALRVGENVIAIHCSQTMGGQYIDAGLDAIVPGKAGKK